VLEPLLDELLDPLELLEPLGHAPPDLARSAQAAASTHESWDSVADAQNDWHCEVAWAGGA
jgi:hypothetical protein